MACPTRTAALIAGILAWSGAPLAANLNDSGLVRCLDTQTGKFGTQCAGTGQDGEFGRDRSHPRSTDGAAGFRFVKVCHSGEQAGQGACPAEPVLGTGLDQWGCTRDQVTGIWWEIKTTDGGLRDWNKSYTRLAPSQSGYGAKNDAAGYLNAVNAAGLCGHTDWQLPTPTALHSLTHYGVQVANNVPTIDAAFFPNTWYGANWSSLSAADSDAKSWFVHFDTDYIGRTDGTIFKRVRLARLDAYTRPAKFKVADDGSEVTDQRTGLVWRRCAEGQAWDGLVCSGTPSLHTWQQALDLAVTTGGGWRLPSAKELATLVDRTRIAPAIDLTVFPSAPADKHWSSTPIIGMPAQAWHVEFGVGEVFRTTRETTLAVRLVR